MGPKYKNRVLFSIFEHAMNTEIELKYIVVCDEVEKRIESTLTRLPIKCQRNTKVLTNTYFDTPDQLFRQADMGLRVRTHNNSHEQTIKTAGKVIGGLHQRPEYNVEICSPAPELSLFSNEIWQDNQNVEQLQEALVPLFTTDFNRQIWLIENQNGSKIELVYDTGNISSGSQSIEINEIELELVTGDASDLFELASALFETIMLRPGSKSKAARGYALWLNTSSDVEVTPFELIPLNHENTIIESFANGVNFGLGQLQVMVEAYIDSPSLSYLEKTVEVMALIRHGFWLFEEHLSEEHTKVRDELSYFLKIFQWVDNASHLGELTNRTGNYRKKLEYSEQLIAQLKLERRKFPNADKVIEILCSARFNNLQLRLLSLLLEFDVEQKITFSSTIQSFARKSFDEGLLLAKNAMTSETALTSELYLSHQKLVIRSLLTGSWFGSLYDKQLRLDFRNPWLDIKHGLSELHTLWVLQLQLDELEKTPEKLIRWHHGKVENLLLALEHSRETALSLEPYWRIS